MVGRPGAYQFSFNAGELAPAVWGNTGLKQFYAGAAQMLNAEPVPQGGFRSMARLRSRASLPLVYGSDGAPAVRILDFTYQRQTATYVVVLTPALATIFKNGVQVAQVSTPYNADDLPYVKRVQRFDTMLLSHPNYPVGRLLRDGSDIAWAFDSPAFTNIPSVKLQGSYVDVAEVWTLDLNWPSTVNGSNYNPNGTNFIISIDGLETNVIALVFSTSVVGGGPLDISAAIKAALENLATVDPGLTVARTFSNATAESYQITFTGGTNPGSTFIVSGRVVSSIYVALSTYRKTIGVPGGEPLFSPSVGYAAACCFYQDRFTLGGFASKTSAFLASRTGEYFDMNIRVPTVASSGLLINLDTDGAEQIIDIIQSKHLVLFTTEADYYISDRALSASAAPNIVQSGNFGCSRRVSVVKQESGLIYVNRDETILYAATYDAVNDAYVSQPLSLLSSHLIADMRDAALQKSFVATDGERYWAVRDDGVAIVAILIRNQEVTAFVRYATDGLIRAVGVDGDNVVHLAVERQVDGLPQLFLETVEEGLLLDAAIDFAFNVPSLLVTGLGIHEGASVWAIVDGYVEGPYVVNGASITLREAASQVTVGRWTPPVVETLPLARDVAAHTVLKRPARVHTVMLDVIDTTSVAIGANDRPARDVGLVTVAQPTDQPIVPVTGQLKVPGLTGWSPEGQVVVTQVKPGQLQVRDMVVEAKI